MTSTLFIGLDGATFTVLDPLMENGTMPFLKEFVKGGTRADLLSTPNPLTPPAWISLMTGRTPGNHGVFDFIWAEERKSDHYFTLYNFRDIQCETIWSIASRQNKRVCSLNFPMMSPPPAVAGCIVPGLVSWKHLRRNVHPSDLYDKLKQLPGFNSKELAWDFDLEKKAERGIPKEEYERWVQFHMRRERLWFDITRHIMRTEPCDLTAILFDGPDKLMHMGYRFLDPKVFPEKPSAWDLKMRDLCLGFFRELDGFIKELVEIAGPDARTLIASDHGFGPTWEVFRVNTWLSNKGYLTWKDLNGLDREGKEKAQKVIDHHFVLLDWDKTTAYARSVTSNGIYIRVAKSPGQSGVPAEQYAAFRSRLIEELLDVRDPGTNERIIKRVMTREEAYPGSCNAQAPDLTLVMRDHSFISILNKEPVVYRRPDVDGTHYPKGIFLAKGPGIRAGETASQMSIADVAPGLLFSLGLDIPGDFEGLMPSHVFEHAYLDAHPCKTGKPTVCVNGDGKAAAPMGEEEKKEIFEQLKALGYME
ncbi:MAG: alkaline phosphatase family protein [Nitrospirae bacterium]|nr:alkaline phosphatase family protein [Nitrospirota bacterium]